MNDVSIWTIKPETTRIDLVYTTDDGAPHPFWIAVKKQLTVGEDRRVNTAGWKGVRQSGRGTSDESPEISIDWRLQAFARVDMWLVDWSLAEDDGKKIAKTRDAIEALPKEVFALIEDAITAHIETGAAIKKPKPGDDSPLTTSG